MKTLFLILPFLFSTFGYGQYCLPAVTGSGGGISNVTLNTLNNTSPLAQGYVSFSLTTAIPNLIKANTEQIQITTAGFQFFGIWIDWNQDLVFGAGEQIPFSAGSGITTLNINVPVGATLGNTRMRVSSRTGFLGGAACTTTQGDGDIEDYTVNIIELPMQVDSVTTSQITYGCFPNNMVDKMVVRAAIEISYTVTPLTLTNLTFNTAGSTSAGTDIANARLYQTNNTTFSKNNPFGTVVTAPNGTFSFTGSYALSPGTNYFWVTYDVTAGATAGNQIEAQLDQVTISSSTYFSGLSSIIFSQPLDARSNYRRKEANIWYNARTLAIDFNCTTPVVVNNQSSIFPGGGTEGTNSLARTNGDLLFYADGSRIYNRVHEIMPNGSGINSNSSKTTGLFIPRPESTTSYFVITPSGQAAGQDTLFYSEIDLTLDNGFGDIVPTIKNVMIMEDPFNEAITAIDHCNGIDVWLTIPRNNSNEIHSFLITSAGINTTPVVSTGAGFPTYNNVGRGTVKFSPDGKWFVVTNQTGTGVAGLPYLFNFDNATGAVSNPIALNTSDRHSASFSPDNSKLYMNQGNNLYQYNLCSADIPASRTFIGSVPGNTLWLIQNAPDGKIYMDPGGNATSYTVINNPNGLSAACNFAANGFSLAPYTHQSTFNFVSAFNESIFNQSILDSNVTGNVLSSNSVCITDTVFFTDTSGLIPGCVPAIPTPRSYSWNFGNPTSGTSDTSTFQNPYHVYNTAGTFTVTFIVTEECQSDTVLKTVIVCPTILPITLASFTGECKPDNTVLLKWSTTSEINNDYFTIEKSANTINWNIIGTIAGAGNSNTFLNYQFIDDNLNNGTSYYRLKQTDFNGNFEYFDITTVENCNNPSDKISIYPNPVGNKLQLRISSFNDANVNIHIFDLLGNIVFEKQTETLVEGSNVITINVEHLSKAMYLLVMEKEGEHLQVKFTK